MEPIVMLCTYCAGFWILRYMQQCDWGFHSSAIWWCING